MTVGAGSQTLRADGRAVAPLSVAAKIESLLGAIVEIAAAGLVVAEIAILFGGVISRYLFDGRWSGRMNSPPRYFFGSLCSAQWLRSGATNICA